MTQFPLQDDTCTCPACRSDVAGLVPCMSADHFSSAAVPRTAVRKNPVRVAPPAGRFSHSLPAGETRGAFPKT